MSKNAIFVKTAKAELASANLSIDLKRVLSYMDGKSRSDDLAKRAPPSLRKQWNELLNELVEGGYIVFNGKAKIEEKLSPRERDPKAGFDDKQVIVAKANESNYPSLSAAEQVVAELEAAAAALEVASHVAAKAVDIPKHNDHSSHHGASAAARVVAELESAAAAAKPSNLENSTGTKADAEAKQKLEKAARAAELKAFFAAAKEKTNVEAKQIEKEAARVRAEQEATAAAKAKLAAVTEANAEAKRKAQDAARTRTEQEAAAKAKLDAKRKQQEASRAQLESAVAAAKARSAAQAQARAAAKQREQETAQACAEVEAAILATKVTSDVEMDIWGGAEAVTPVAKPGRKYLGDPRPYVWRARSIEMQAGDTKRLRDMEIENECLKKLLTDAYVEIETLKASKC